MFVYILIFEGYVPILKRGYLYLFAIVVVLYYYVPMCEVVE